jgi:hypothetical protein
MLLLHESKPENKADYQIMGTKLKANKNPKSKYDT